MVCPNSIYFRDLRWLLRKSFCLVFLFFVGLPFESFAVDSAASDKVKKIEELYIWKVSDELKLSTKQEIEFAKAYRDFNIQKSILSQKSQKTLESMKGKKEKALKPILTEYKKTLKELQNLQIKEIEFMEKQFGFEKAALYIQLKQNLSDEIRSALSRKEK